MEYADLRGTLAEIRNDLLPLQVLVVLEDRLRHVRLRPLGGLLWLLTTAVHREGGEDSYRHECYIQKSLHEGLPESNRITRKRPVSRSTAQLLIQQCLRQVHFDRAFWIDSLLCATSFSRKAAPSLWASWPVKTTSGRNPSTLVRTTSVTAAAFSTSPQARWRMSWLSNPRSPVKATRFPPSSIR